MLLTILFEFKNQRIKKLLREKKIKTNKFFKPNILFCKFSDRIKFLLEELKRFQLRLRCICN